MDIENLLKNYEENRETVDILLIALSDLERFVIEKLYFEKLDFIRLSEAYYKRYEIPIKIKVLKGVKTKALKKMQSVVNI